ncbi:hypothetical protein LTR94_030072 [Friedmanniomyces endolithicus]|nr:hypothetical protein LTR94_030072 [Friedmanniomyces endolithicus]
MTPIQAAGFARIALGHVTREYPHKADHVMAGDGDVYLPRRVHPIFFGSFDWHSCVHGYWLLARIRRLFPDLPEAAAIDALFADAFTAPDDWKRLAWWIHDHLRYSSLEFFPDQWTVNVQWHERPLRMIYSHIPEARGYLTKPGMDGHVADHRDMWDGIAPHP